MIDYETFLIKKAQLDEGDGFDPLWMPDWLFDFQISLVEWALRKGRAAIFADCGLGKTPMQLVWAENVVRKTNRPVLILTPLAVSHQTLQEAKKFDIEANRITHKAMPGINIINYERLHHLDPSEFAAVVCDESSILKSFDGVRRAQVTEFLRLMEYRLLCTATAAPNDYIELGTSSEALGYLGHMDMLGRFFRNDRGTTEGRRMHGQVAKWRFKGHAERPFWRWVSSWARACRKPSDLGFDDGDFILPPLHEHEHLIADIKPADGMLLTLPAVGLREQREERRRTIEARCEQVAELINGANNALVWCHLNDEGDLLSNLIPGAKQIKGSDTDEAKEERFLAFANGDLRVLVTKPVIGGWGLNFQVCNRMTFFPSHSYEQYYQGVRRCWRFGQTRSVRVDIVTTEGEKDVLRNVQKKADAAERMFERLVEDMHLGMSINRSQSFDRKQEIPAWM